MDFFKDLWNDTDSAVRKGICIALAIVMLFSSGYITGAMTNISGKTETVISDGAAQVDATVNTTTATAAPVTTTAPVTESTTAAAPVDTTAAPADTTAAPADTTAAASTGAPATTEEIVALFNESANKIKTTAKQATRNYQDMRINKLDLPSALQSLADSAIAKYVKPDMTPQVYVGPEVAEKYPVSGTDFASKLKPEYLETITCTDNGTEYVIDIRMKDQLNPVYRGGEGVASIFWTMNIDDIANNVPGLQKAELSYYNCTATAKIDKATGNMTYTKFDYNYDMILDIKMITTLHAEASMTVIEEYVIEY